MEDLESISDTQDLIDSDLITIFPSPVATILSVQTDLQFDRYSIYNIDGKLIVSDVFLQQIPVSEMKGGMYTLHLENEDGVAINKFIKM